jgi:hypothetical protein
LTTNPRKARAQKRHKSISEPNKGVLETTQLGPDELWATENPLREKELIESFQWQDTLEAKLAKTKAGIVTYSPPDRDAHYIETYHRCFCAASSRQRLKIVSDFVAYYPHLAFGAHWLHELLDEEVRRTRLERRSGKNPLLDAIAKGFRSASNTATWENSRARTARVIYAKMFRDVIKKRLQDWLDTLGKRELHPSTEWLDEHVQLIYDELAQRFSCVTKVQDELKRHLVNRRTYDAANLIAATVHPVSMRDLESRSIRTARFSPK